MNPRSYILAAVVAVHFSAPVLADERQALAEEYVNMPEVQQMITDLFSPDVLLGQFEAGLPDTVTLSEGQKLRIGTVLSDALNDLRPKIESVMIESSADTFTTEELVALIDFYRSEHGAAVMSKMQPFMQRSMSELGPVMRQLQVEITPELVKIRRLTSPCLPASNAWKRALCSLSIGRRLTPFSAASCITKEPPETKASLLASPTSFPASIAATVGANP